MPILGALILILKCLHAQAAELLGFIRSPADQLLYQQPQCLSHRSVQGHISVP